MTTTHAAVERIARVIAMMLENYPVETTAQDRAYLTEHQIFQLSHHLTGALISQFEITTLE
jgi:hypothetical protein